MGCQVRGIGKTFDTLGDSVFKQLRALEPSLQTISPSRAASTYSVYFGEVGRVDDTPVYKLEDLKTGEVVDGPAMILDDTQTIVVTPNAKAVVMPRHLVILL